MASTSQQIVVTIGGVPTILDVDANLWGTGTVASRPASGDNVGDIYIVQDPPLYRIDVWNGAAWVKATVVGPTGGSTDNALVRWDGAGGDILNNSVVAIDDSGNMTGVGTINGGSILTATAIASMSWSYESSSVVMADPGLDQFRLNNATPTSATAIALSAESESVADLQGPLSTLQAGDYIIAQSRADIADYIVWQINTITDNTTWFNITVTAIDFGSNFTDEDYVVFTFMKGDPTTALDGTAWRYQDGFVGMSDPGLDRFRINNNTHTSATAMAVSSESRKFTDAKEILRTLRDGDLVEMVSRSEPANFHIFEVTGTPTDNTTWIQIPISSVEAGTEWADGEYVYFKFHRGVDALHTTTAGEINALTAKGSPTSADLLLIEDVADSNNKKKVTIGTLPVTDPDAIHDNVAGEINAITAKTTPISTDLVLIEDSNDSNNKKKATLGSLPFVDNPTSAVTTDVMARWDAGGTNRIQGTGIGVNDTDQMTGITTASFVDYMVPLAGSAVTIDWNDSASQWIILGANSTFTFTSPPAGSRVMLRVIQDSTGSRLVTWPSTVRWLGGSAPTLSTAAGDGDIVTFFFDGSTYWGSSAGAAAWDLVQELADAYSAHLFWAYSGVTDAFPVLEEITETVSAFGTSHTLDLPATVNEGDLLLVSLSFGLNDTNVSSADADFTQIQAPLDSNNAVTLAMYLRRADGTEGGGTFDLTLSTSSFVMGQVHRFRAGTYYDDGTLANAYTLGTAFVDLGDSSPNPPQANPGTAAKYHFVTVFAADEEPTVSGYPTNYINGTATRNGAGGGTATTLGSATRELDAASDTPDAFTISAAEESVSQTIAIHPPEGLVLDLGPNGDHGLVTNVSSAVGAGLLTSDLGSRPTDGPTGYANVPAITDDITATHSVLKLFNYTAAATLFDIDDSGGYRSAFVMSSGTLRFSDGTLRDTVREEASLENQPVLLGYTRTSTTNIDVYENGLKWRSLTTGTFSTQTAPEVSDGATAAGASASDGDMGFFGIFGARLSEAEHYDVWKRLTGQKHLWREFVVPNGIDANCEQYLPLWEGAGTQLIDVSGGQEHGQITGTMTYGGVALDDYHVACLEGDGTSDYITGTNNINVATTTTWTIAGLCSCDADGDGVFSFGSASNSIGMRTSATGNLQVYKDDGTTTTQTITRPSGTFAWCVRRNGNTLDWWINGIKQTALDLTGASFSSSTLHYLMADIDLGLAASLDGRFQHRGTYSAAFADTICELLGDINLVDQSPVA